MNHAELRTELLNLLATHAQEPTDYVALFMFLNTVAGGHYEERYGEPDIRRVLSELLRAGDIEAWSDHERLGEVEPGVTTCVFRLPRAGAN